MMRGFVRLAMATATVVITAVGGNPADDDSRPRETDKTETVEVRLVTVDLVVLDENDRTVPGLGPEDFRVTVDGRPVAVDTLDSRCTGDPVEDPRGGAGPGEWTADGLESDEPRRLVFALDYLHLPILPCPDLTSGPCNLHSRVLEELERVIPERMEDGDEVMIAALTGGLRIEQPFTTDSREVSRTLERMAYDVTLLAGNFAHLTEFPLFESLEALVDVLGTVPGPKGVVMFSGGSGPGIAYDNDYRALASRAAAARVSFYTVDCLGLYAGRFT
jgi:VWFA-related protein